MRKPRRMQDERGDLLSEPECGNDSDRDRLHGGVQRPHLSNMHGDDGGDMHDAGG